MVRLPSVEASAPCVSICPAELCVRDPSVLDNVPELETSRSRIMFVAPVGESVSEFDPVMT